MPDGSTPRIPTLEVTQESEMLGVFFSPAGDGRSHLRKMKEKGTLWAERLRTRPLSRRDAWMSLQYQLMPGLTWGLATVTMSPEAINKEMQSFYFAILGILGVNRNIAKEWRMLPEKYHGLGLPNFAILSLSGKIHILHEHFGFKNALGEMMHQAYEALVIEVGAYGNTLSLPFAEYGALGTKNTWFRSLWESSQHFDVGIAISANCHLSPVRVNDRSLIECFREDGFEGESLSKLSRVLHFKRLVHLSDIVLCDGTTIDKTMLGRYRACSRYTFPKEKPTRTDFAFFDMAIKWISSPTLSLHHPLGDFISQGHLIRRWRSSPDGRFLSFSDETNDSTVHIFGRDEHRRQTRYGQTYSRCQPTADSPPHNQFASVSRINEESVTLHSRATLSIPPPTPTDFRSVLASYDNQSLFENLHCDGDGSWIRQGLLSGSLEIVHDGSFMPQTDTTTCSAATFIFCTDSKQSCKATVAERSNRADNYRAELLGGILTQLILRAASALPFDTHVLQTVCCDNRGVVGHGNSASTGLRSKQAQADTLRTLKQLILTANYDTDYVWVPAHQDDTKRRKDLTLRERMNVRVDSLAKQALLASIVSRTFINNNFPLESIRISIGDTKITDDVPRRIEDHWGRKVAKELYNKKHIIDKSCFEDAWWEGARIVMKDFPRTFQVFVTKQTSRFCGTNRQLSRYDPSVINACPSCGQDDESPSHITRCPDPGRRAMWEYSVAEMSDWLARTVTDIPFRYMISTYLLSQGSKQMIECSQRVPHLQDIARHHDRLGWDNFVEGRISTHYLTNIKSSLPQRSRLTPTSWAKKFVQKLIIGTHKQWLYRNAHVHYKKLDGLTEADQTLIFTRVEELLHTDPLDLLPSHRCLLDGNFEALGEGSAANRQHWIVAMESALTAAEYVRAGGATRTDHD